MKEVKDIAFDCFAMACRYEGKIDNCVTEQLSEAGQEIESLHVCVSIKDEKIEQLEQELSQLKQEQNKMRADIVTYYEYFRQLQGLENNFGWLKDETHKRRIDLSNDAMRDICETYEDFLP